MSQKALEAEFRSAIKSAGNKPSTFDSYWPHVLDFVNFARRHHGAPIDRSSVSMDDVYRFRSILAADKNLSPKSVNQAMSAIRFLFIRVLQRDFVSRENDPIRVKEAKRQRRRMISMKQIQRVTHFLSPHDQLIAMMMYGCMQRLDDVLNVRIKDLNFDDQQLEIADCKHDHFRVVPLPVELHELIRQQMQRVKMLQEMDVRYGRPGAAIPYAFASKAPKTPNRFDWYWLFPSRRLSRAKGVTDGPKYRWHIDDDAYRKRFTQAVRDSCVYRRITCHDFRRGGATHFYRATKDIERLREILGHNSVEQTFDYIFASEIAISGSDSPLAAMLAA